MTTLCLHIVLAASVCAQPNVIFLSVDTLRSDYLGCYGYPHDASPNLDAFSRDALVFDNCVCEVPLTNPSFGSMLSSLYPRTTGATRNGLRMPDSAPLITERFRAAGYQTVCVQSNWTLRSRLSGLERGFEVYEEDFHKRRWGVIKPERYAEDVTDVALDLLRQRDANRPLFVWIHYSDPHAPYRFHRKYNPLGKRPFRLKNVEKVRVKYASEVAYTDYHIGRLLEEIPLDAGDRPTAILFVSDHGESLYEHDYLGHGRRIYHDNMLIPLMIQAPGVKPGRTTVHARALDIGPTLLGLAGLAPMPGMLGKNLLAENPAMSRTRVVETYGGAVPKMPGAKALMADAAPQRMGVILEGWKLILGARHPELFHLPEDPGELNNLASAMPEKVAALRHLIEAWEKEYPRGKARETSLTDDDIEALKSLGYLD